MSTNGHRRHREFKAKDRAVEPITFDLEGESFTCVPEAPAAVLTDFLGDITSEHVGRSAQALVGFITDVLVEEDVERFLSHVHSKEVVVPIELLGEVVTWLIEEYGDRPTEPPSSSRGGRRTTQGGSTGSSASPGNRGSVPSRSSAP